MMTAYKPMEVIVLPNITYIYRTAHNEFRRIHTDGRYWPGTKSRLSPAIASADRSMRMATGITTRSKSKRET
jgi:hypothetical protein